jgi:hypothetical protein
MPDQDHVLVPKSRLDQLVLLCTVTHVDGRPIPASRVLSWVETNLVDLGGAPCMRSDGRRSQAEFQALDPHNFDRVKGSPHSGDTAPCS